jgi:uncharacterized membrane protein YkoI
MIHGYDAPVKIYQRKSQLLSISIVGMSSIAALAMVSVSAFALNGAQYLGQAKLSLKQAREIALTAYHGKISSEELEKESGGSGLRYSFVIVHGNAKHEVGVDAKTGKVLENSVEGANPD